MRTRNSAKQQNSMKVPSPDKVRKEHKDLQASIKTPKVKKRRSDQWLHTPGREDGLLFSQHFDSQVVVGWDCNSPDHIRGLRKFSAGDGNDVTDLIKLIADEEEDAPVVDARNTPPLLGLWKDSTDHGDKLLDNGPQNKLQKKKRNRKKSGKDAVSQALFEKLALALDKTEDVEEEEADDGEEEDDQTSDVYGETEQQTTALNCSHDLFELTTQEKLPVQKTLDSAKNAARASFKNGFNELDNQKSETAKKSSSSQEGWSDDEFLEGDDSFIVKATQQPANVRTFNSPVFGIKRKGSNVGDQPKTKCSRFSFQLGDSNNNQKSGSLSGSRFTSLQSKVKLTNGSTMEASKSQTGTICITRNNDSTLTGVTVSTTLASVAYAQSTTVHSSNKSTLSSLGNNTGNQSQVTSVSSKFYSNKTLQARSVMASISSSRPTSSTVGSFPQHRPLHSSVSSVYNTTRPTGPRLAHTNVSRNLQYGSGSGSNSSFRKHNSFSGPDSPTQHSHTTRRRSVSGDEARQAAARNIGGASVIPQNQNVSSDSKAVNNQTSFSVSKPPTIPNRVVNSVQGKPNSSIQNITSVNRGGGSVIGKMNTSIQSSAFQRQSVSQTKPVVSTVYGKPSTSQVTVCSSMTVNKPTFIVPSSTLSNKQQTKTDSCKTSIANKGYQFRHSKTNSAVVSLNSSSIITLTRSRDSKTSTISEVVDFFTSPSTTRVTRSTPSKNHFLDTSISDDLMCQLAEPDEMFESQADVTVTKVDKLDLAMTADNTEIIEPSRLDNNDFDFLNDFSDIKSNAKVSSGKSISACNQQSSLKTKIGQVKPVCAQTSMKAPKSAKSTEQGKAYRFRDKQKSAVESERNTVLTRSPATRDHQYTLPEKTTSKASKMEKALSAPVVDFSEDLFSGDDDMLLSDDDLDEPQLLAMLDEVEMLATQQNTTTLPNTTAARIVTTLDTSTCHKPLTINHQQNQRPSQFNKVKNIVISQTDNKTGINPHHNQKPNQTTQTKAINMAKTCQLDSNIVPVGTNYTELSGSQERQSSSQGQISSQGQSNSQPTSGSQNKYSPEEIERKKQLALAKRKNRAVQVKR